MKTQVRGLVYWVEQRVATVKSKMHGESKARQELFHQSLFAHISLSYNSSSLGIGTFISSWYLEGIFHRGISTSCFQEEKERSELAPAVFEVPLAQNNQYAKAAYFWLLCP